MATALKTRPAPATDKTQAVMDALTANVIAAIEAGIADPKNWTPPWHNVMGGAVNAVTHRHYQGGNVLMLAFSGHAGPWATFKQWQSVGATVKKGEKGTPILTPRPVQFVKEDKNGNEQDVRFVRYRVAYVFAADQVDGWDAPETALPTPTGERNADADALLAAWSGVVPITHTPGNRAFYVPATDSITLPPYEQFVSAEGYYATGLHECVHSTGHASRLNREHLGHLFGSAEYAREELCGELGSAFLMQRLGIAGGDSIGHGDDQQHAAYLNSWLRALKNDTSYLWGAAADASKAVRMLLETAGMEA